MLTFIAGVLSIVVGIIHSALGEILIFNKLRKGTLIPTIAPAPLLEKHIRILWATWHIASVFGWAFGALLIAVSKGVEFGAEQFIQYTGVAMFLSGVLVFVATKARHPGWLGLCVVGVLCWVA